MPERFTGYSQNLISPQLPNPAFCARAMLLPLRQLDRGVSAFRPSRYLGCCSQGSLNGSVCEFFLPHRVATAAPFLLFTSCWTRVPLLPSGISPSRFGAVWRRCQPRLTGAGGRKASSPLAYSQQCILLHVVPRLERSDHFENGLDRECPACCTASPPRAASPSFSSLSRLVTAAELGCPFGRHSTSS